MKYKYKFYLTNKEENICTEIATCTDEMTANFLSDYYRKVYTDKKFIVECKFKKTVYVI